jgi:hypothetical protein
MSAPALLSPATAAPPNQPPVGQQPDGRLVYAADDRGNRVPDFSHCGYAGGERAIPRVPMRVAVTPADGDDGERIQRAIDHVAALPVGDDGFRGAVLLLPGRFEVAGQIRIAASGVVLRGSGALDDGGTVIVAAGLDRRPLVRVEGGGEPTFGGEPLKIVDDYVPVGSLQVRVSSASELRPGQTVMVTRASTAKWIKQIGADAFGVGWRPGSRDVRWDRVVERVRGDVVTLDAPITTAIDAELVDDTGNNWLAPYQWPERLENVGLEDVALESAFRTEHAADEDHAWLGVVMQGVRDAWVRRVTFRNFAGGAVLLRDGVSRTTIEDCAAVEPVSELGGYRRMTYFTQGQLTLFLRCWAESGLHDFCVGHGAAGPNAFVNCRADRAHGDSGPRESWASGVLYDNVRVDGAGLHLENRWASPPGAGWAAANCMLWQCRAGTMRVFRPPTATNWAVGVWAEFAGDGEFFGRSDFATPFCLYEAQLAERIGKEAAAKRVGKIPGKPVGATNPSIDEAQRFAADSRYPPRRWEEDVIENIRRGAEAARRERADVQELGADADASRPAAGNEAKSASKGSSRLALKNGWLTIDGRVVTGSKLDPMWWRGTIRPEEAGAQGPAITRFAPGRDGRGLTDGLTEVVDGMIDSRVAAYEHHYGLWYDRRRDDHLMERRADGEVAPPFYEQPFARTGQGRAWDGLSKYDLTKPNPWYWSRLHDFARLCDERGLVLMHQHYFQHNILEAGAHWVDSPWQPANNINPMGLPDPPPFVGDKRIFMTPAFYDPSQTGLRKLHRGYIRQCLDALADCTNVLHLTSAEYSGPREFVEFWIDCVAEWEDEHQKNVLVGLSAPKDVQDAILADETRGGRVDVIDIRYWAYTADGGLYAPAGGQNLAPRQHLRMTKKKPGGFNEITKAVREYRMRYPNKAVTYYADEHCPSEHDGWAVLRGGGSLADVALPEELAQAVVGMSPRDDVTDSGWCLGREDDEFLIDLEHGIPIDSKERVGRLIVKLPAGKYRVTTFNRVLGALTDGGVIDGGADVKLPGQSTTFWLRRVVEPARSAPQTPRRG